MVMINDLELFDEVRGIRVKTQSEERSPLPALSAVVRGGNRLKERK